MPHLFRSPSLGFLLPQLHRLSRRKSHAHVPAIRNLRQTRKEIHDMNITTTETVVTDELNTGGVSASKRIPQNSPPFPISHQMQFDLSDCQNAAIELILTGARLYDIAD